MPVAEADAERILIEEIRSYAQDRISNVDHGAETAELAALLTDKVAWGIHLAARALGYHLDTFTRAADDLVRHIDPDFVANRSRRWTSAPASLHAGPAASSPRRPR